MNTLRRHTYIYTVAILAASGLFATAVLAQTADRYEKAQVVYRADNIAELLKVAERLGEATAEPLTLDGLPGAPSVDISAQEDELSVVVSGAGEYRVEATVFDADRETLDKLSGTEFVIPWAAYESPATLVLYVTYLPQGASTFFGASDEVSDGKLPSGITLPPVRGITPPEEEPVSGAPERIQEFNLTFALERETAAVFEEELAEEEFIAPEEEIKEVFEEEAVPAEDELGTDFFEFGEDAVSEEDAFEEVAEEAPLEEPGFFDVVGDFFTGLFGGEEESALFEEESVAEEPELFTPDASSLVVLDYTREEREVSVALSLYELFDFNETPLTASLIFASVANPSKQLEFSEAIPEDLFVRFTIPRSVLRVLGSELLVLLKLTSQINGLSVVSTYVLGVAHEL